MAEGVPPGIEEEEEEEEEEEGGGWKGASPGTGGSGGFSSGGGRGGGTSSGRGGGGASVAAAVASTSSFNSPSAETEEGGGASDDVTSLWGVDKPSPRFSGFSPDPPSAFPAVAEAAEPSTDLLPPSSFAAFSLLLFTSLPTSFSTCFLAIIFRAIISLSFRLFPVSIGGGGEGSRPRLPLLPERCRFRRFGEDP